MSLIHPTREDEDDDDDDAHKFFILILFRIAFILVILRLATLGGRMILGKASSQRTFRIPPEPRTVKSRDHQDNDEPPEDHWLQSFQRGTWTEKCKAVTRGMQQLSLNEVAVTNCIPLEPDWDAGHLMRSRLLIDDCQEKNRGKRHVLTRGSLIRMPPGRLGAKSSGETGRSD